MNSLYSALLLLVISIVAIYSVFRFFPYVALRLIFGFFNLSLAFLCRIIGGEAAMTALYEYVRRNRPDIELQIENEGFECAISAKSSFTTLPL